MGSQPRARMATPFHDFSLPDRAVARLRDSRPREFTIAALSSCRQATSGFAARSHARRLARRLLMLLILKSRSSSAEGVALRRLSKPGAPHRLAGVRRRPLDDGDHANRASMIGKSGNRFPGKIVLLPGKSTPPDEAAGGKQDHADNGSGNAVFEADVVYRGVMPGHEAWQLVGGKYEIDNGTIMHKNELPGVAPVTGKYVISDRSLRGGRFSRRRRNSGRFHSLLAAPLNVSPRQGRSRRPRQALALQPRCRLFVQLREDLLQQGRRGDARAVPRARAAGRHGADLLAQEPRPGSLARRLAFHRF